MCTPWLSDAGFHPPGCPGYQHPGSTGNDLGEMTHADNCQTGGLKMKRKNRMKSVIKANI